MFVTETNNDIMYILEETLINFTTIITYSTAGNALMLYSIIIIVQL